MNIVDTIYQHVKMLPDIKALEVLEFIERIEKSSSQTKPISKEKDLLEFIQTLSAKTNDSDTEINQRFQALKDE